MPAMPRPASVSACNRMSQLVRRGL
jgi:hypothetical protein